MLVVTNHTQKHTQPIKSILYQISRSRLFAQANGSPLYRLRGAKLGSKPFYGGRELTTMSQPLLDQLPAFESRRMQRPFVRNKSVVYSVDAIDKTWTWAGYNDTRDPELSGRVALSHVWSSLRNT
jgi:hypothetical protein